VTPEELAGFARRAAAFLVQLSAQGHDPLGFPLARDVELDVDPPLDRRIALAAWARRAGHQIGLRGQMQVLAIPVHAPWPLRLELIGAELGIGTCGGLGLFLRLDAGGTVPVIEHAPVMLILPAEPARDRGRRFERWLSGAYLQAVNAWHRWS
jgi:hypothetical protein